MSTDLDRDKEEGRKDDDGKPRWDLLPFKALSSVVDVLTYGARKYGPGNWRKVPRARSRYLAAAFRHLVAACRGEACDRESGLPHLAHAACCLLFLIELEDGEHEPVASEADQKTRRGKRKTG